MTYKDKSLLCLHYFATISSLQYSTFSGFVVVLPPLQTSVIQISNEGEMTFCLFKVNMF